MANSKHFQATIKLKFARASRFHCQFNEIHTLFTMIRPTWQVSQKFSSLFALTFFRDMYLVHEFVKIVLLEIPFSGKRITVVAYVMHSQYYKTCLWSISSQQISLLEIGA